MPSITGFPFWGFIDSCKPYSVSVPSIVSETFDRLSTSETQSQETFSSGCDYTAADTLFADLSGRSPPSSLAENSQSSDRSSCSSRRSSFSSVSSSIDEEFQSQTPLSEAWDSWDIEKDASSSTAEAGWDVATPPSWESVTVAPPAEIALEGNWEPYVAPPITNPRYVSGISKAAQKAVRVPPPEYSCPLYIDVENSVAAVRIGRAFAACNGHKRIKVRSLIHATINEGCTVDPWGHHITADIYHPREGEEEDEDSDTSQAIHIYVCRLNKETGQKTTLPQRFPDDFDFAEVVFDWVSFGNPTSEESLALCQKGQQGDVDGNLLGVVDRIAVFRPCIVGMSEEDYEAHLRMVSESVV